MTKQEKILLRRIESLKSALKIIVTWCSYEQGRFADIRNIENLADKTLKEDEKYEGKELRK